MKRRSLWLPAIAALIVLTAIAPAYSSEFVVCTVEEDQKSPAIAYNSTADEFLVVWEDYVWKSIGTLGIAAQRVGLNGSLIGQSFAVVGEWFTFRPFTNPDLVYNPTANEYLLVWEYAHTADDHHIYARRLPSTIKAPEEVIGSDHIHIADTPSYESNPQVAFNPTDNEYLIVWEHRHLQTITTGSGTIDIIQNDIYGQRLSAAGSILGSPLLIATTSLDQSAPAVVFGNKQNTYLVAWQETISSGEIDIYGQRIGAAGSLLGGKIAISTHAHEQLAPRVAYNSKRDEFLVVWEDHQGNFGDDRDIMGRIIPATGTPQTGPFLISWEGDDQRFQPDIAYNPAVDEYLVTWGQTIWPDSPPQKPGGPVYVLEHTISQRRLASDGSRVGDEMMVSTQGIFSQTKPAITPSDTAYLIVWEDDRNVDMALDLYGAVVKLDALTGHVYEGYIGDESSPLSNVAIELYCSNNAGQLGSLLANTVTDTTGSYTIALDNVCEYYNIRETDPTGYLSTGASSAGTVREDNWIELTYPLSASEMSDNNFWDILDPPPGTWSDFSPTDWVTSQSVTCTVKVADTGSGLDVSTTQYAYYQNTSWSSWQAASCTGTDGTTLPQTITALSVPFSHDSTTSQPNRIKFRIADMSGSTAESPAYNVFIDTTPPINPTLTADRDPHTWSGDAQITFSWSGASDTASGVDHYLYQWSTSSTTIPDGALSTTATTLSTTIPTEGNNNYFHLTTVDEAGNKAATSRHLGPFYLDTSPPAILSGPTISSTSSSSATITWQTTEEADSTVNYTNKAGPYTMQETEASLVTDHAITITSLTAFTTYRLMVQSTDTSGKRVESAEVTFETPGPADTINPTVSLIDPGVCRGRVALSATASDDRGVECVVFSIDGDIIGIDYTAPYQVLWDTEKLTNKDYIITARAVDFFGKSSVDDMRKPVDNLKNLLDPKVDIFHPVEGSTVSGKTRTWVNVKDDSGWSDVEWFVDGQKIASGDGKFPTSPSLDIEFWWDTAFWQDGPHTFGVLVTDEDGKTGADLIDVTIANGAPPKRPNLIITEHTVTRHVNYFGIDLRLSLIHI